MAEIPPAVDDPDDLYTAYRTFVGIRMSFIQDEVRPFSQNTDRGANFWPALAQAWMMREQCESRLQLLDQTIRRRRIFEGNQGIDFE